MPRRTPDDAAKVLPFDSPTPDGPWKGGVNVGGENISQHQQVSFADAARFWIKLGFISFGGPAGQGTLL